VKAERAIRLAQVIRVLAGLLVCGAFIAGMLAGSASITAARAAGLVAGTQFLPSLSRFVASGLSGLGWAWIAILVLTAIFGRFYCSVLCPLGLFQDAASWIWHMAAGIMRTVRRGRRSAQKAKHVPQHTLPVGGRLRRITRVVLSVVGVASAIFAPALLSWMEPYTIATRLGSAALGTSWDALGELAVRARVDLPAGVLRLDPAWMILAITSGLFVIVASAFHSRFFCRWFCPAGAILELISTRPVFGFRIQADACTSCGACERVCRTGAASSGGKVIDPGACVSCFDCVAVCPTGAAVYGRLDTPPGIRGIKTRSADEPTDGQVSRRNFLIAGGTGVAAAAFALPVAALVPGGGSKALVTLNGIPRQWASPPGSVSLERYTRLCISCGLCARACPSGVLRQGTAFWKFPSLFVPYMDYERAFCQFECVACAEVCPTGAIRLLPVAAKTIVAVAKSRLDLPKCIVVEKGTRCGACAEHCPSGALSMEKVAGAVHPGPVLDDTLCIGCGACETVCPSEPVKALVVSGILVHEDARVLPVRPGSGAQSSPTSAGEPGGGGKPVDASTADPGSTGTEGFAF